MKCLLIVFISLFSFLVKAQFFGNIALKTGVGIGQQNKTSEILNEDNGLVFAWAIGLEPELLVFGNAQQFKLTFDLFYMQKGGQNTSFIQIYDQFGQLQSKGSTSTGSYLNYFSLTPCYKFQFGKMFFAKAGPRLDIFCTSHFGDLPPGEYSPDSFYTYESVTYGISYGFGFQFGEKKLSYLLEFLGQNDFTSSSSNSSTGQTFQNNAYLLNLGLVYAIK